MIKVDNQNSLGRTIAYVFRMKWSFTHIISNGNRSWWLNSLGEMLNQTIAFRCCPERWIGRWFSFEFSRRWRWDQISWIKPSQRKRWNSSNNEHLKRTALFLARRIFRQTENRCAFLFCIQSNRMNVIELIEDKGRKERQKKRALFCISSKYAWFIFSPRSFEFLSMLLRPIWYLLWYVRFSSIILLVVHVDRVFFSR